MTTTTQVLVDAGSTVPLVLRSTSIPVRLKGYAAAAVAASAVSSAVTAGGSGGSP